MIRCEKEFMRNVFFLCHFLKLFCLSPNRFHIQSFFFSPSASLFLSLCLSYLLCCSLCFLFFTLSLLFFFSFSFSLSLYLSLIRVSFSSYFSFCLLACHYTSFLCIFLYLFNSSSFSSFLSSSLVSSFNPFSFPVFLFYCDVFLLF